MSNGHQRGAAQPFEPPLERGLGENRLVPPGNRLGAGCRGDGPRQVIDLRRSGLHRYSAGGQGIGAQGKCLRAISCRELAQQRAQLESTVDLPQPRDVGLAARELVRLHGKLEVASDRC